MILRASAHPLVQLNIDEGMLDPTKENPMPSNRETHQEKIRKALLLNETNARFHREPTNSTTCLLTAAVYLKVRKSMFNKGTQVEAATKFNMKSKALGQILLGKLTGVARTGKPQQKGRACLHLQQSSHWRRGKANP